MWDIVAIAMLCLALLVAAAYFMWSDIVVIAGLCAAPLIYYSLLNIYAYYFVFRPIRDARKHLTFADFQREFEEANLSNRALEIAYLELTRLTGFPVVRSDHLWDTLHLERDALEDSLTERLKALGMGDVYSTVRVDTVEDYVNYWSYILRADPEKCP